MYRLFIATLIFAPIAYGSVETWSLGIMEAGLFAALLSLVIMEARSETPTLRRAPGTAVYLLFLLFVALQLLPLPQALLGIISPRTLEFYREAGVAEGGAWLSLSLVPKETLAEFFRFASYGAAYYLAVQLLATRRRLKGTVRILVIFVTVFTFVAIVQRLLPGEFLFTFRTMPQKHYVFGTYLNRNHYAGLMELFLPMVFALFLLERPRAATREFWSRLAGVFTAPGTSLHIMLGFSAMLMASSVVLCLSRGGMLAAALSLIVLGGLLLWRGHERRGLLVGLAAIVFAVVYVGWFGWDVVFERFDRIFTQSGELNLLRPRVWRDVMEIGGDFPAAGTGLGTLMDVYPAYRSIPGSSILRHAHNDYLQTWATAGIAGSLLLAAFMITVLYRTFRVFLRRRRSYSIYLYSGAVAGIAGLLVHSFSDFNLQAGANGLFFFFLFGLAVAAANTRVHEVKEPTYLPAARLPGGAIPAVICAAGLLAGSLVFNGGAVTASLVSSPETAALFDPLEADHRRRQAEEAWRAGDREGALAAVNKAAALAPTRSETLQRRGMLLDEAGRIDEAKRSFAAGVRFDIRNSRRREIYGSWLLARGMKEEGLAAYGEAIRFTPRSVKDYITAMVLYGLSDDEIAQAMPEDTTALLGFAEYLEAVENNDGARLAYRRALDAALAEKRPQGKHFYRVSRFYRRLGLDDQALGVLREGIAAGAESAYLHMEAGAIYEKMLNYNRALEEYRAALLIDPGHKRARIGLQRVSSRVL